MLVRYLPNPLYVLVLVYMENLDGNSLTVVSAFPNIAVTPTDNRVLTRLDEFLEYDMGVREQSRSTAKLSEFLKYLCITLWDCKNLFGGVVLRLDYGMERISWLTLSNTSNNPPVLASSPTREER